MDYNKTTLDYIKENMIYLNNHNYKEIIPELQINGINKALCGHYGLFYINKDASLTNKVLTCLVISDSFIIVSDYRFKDSKRIWFNDIRMHKKCDSKEGFYSIYLIDSDIIDIYVGKHFDMDKFKEHLDNLIHLSNTLI